jgi:hypothetical protein
VSSCAQVVALWVRSAFKKDKSIEEQQASGVKELDVPLLLNRVLPSLIRIVAFTPAPDVFNARFRFAS